MAPECYGYLLPLEIAQIYPPPEFGQLPSVVEKWLNGVDELSIKSVPIPIIGENEVLVKVKAVGLNFFDILMKGSGKSTKPSPAFPFIPGAELVEKFADFKVGDGVFGTGSNGISGYAEYFLGIVFRGQLKKGDVCLIHAAAGGVGIAAVQIAKNIGATVIATAGSDEKCQIAKAEGADYVINYVTDTNWPATVNKITAAIPGRKAKGADVIYDPVGFFIKDTACIAFNGRILVVGFAGTGSAIEAVPSNRLLLKGASLVGVFWGGTTINDRKLAVDTWKGVFDLFSKEKPGGGNWKPVVFPKNYTGLESIPTALADLASRKTWGKVVVRLDSSHAKL
ncbi:hypothetical protein BC829DRAFT_426184 [Chytridium lagenaria]|nr:hypothetical protein BC829DRAFT_426184 [Chytridium lagenaria]